MLALALAVAAALPAFWKRDRPAAEFGTLAFGFLVAAWFAWRAWISPVAEFGQADLFLLAGAVASFISLRAIEGNALAERILIWGIALLLLANVVTLGKQVLDPAFTPVFRTRAGAFPSGFYSHYNEAANYLIASSLLLGAAALFGTQGRASRTAWGLIAVAGLAAVYFTRSRGGILGAGVGCGVFAVAALMIGHRRKARWFAPAVIAVPVLGLVVCGFIYLGWQGSQELRNPGASVAGMMDNNSRLHLLGIALSCIGLHPMAGGGSRSFSWESFRFFENKLHGDIITHTPEQVHNELVQAATDYGLIGAGLLVGLLGTLVILAVVRVLFAAPSREADAGDAWRLGGLAALAGMAVQSSFSFVFHLLPGVVLLGISLGMIARGPARGGWPVGAKVILSAAALACLAALVLPGWQGLQVTRILWPSHFSKVPLTTYEAKIDALSDAIDRWPQPSLYQERAFIHQAAAAGSGAVVEESAQRAIRDYEAAERLHRHDPNLPVNRANLLSTLQRDAEAELAYERAIQLQGGMEPAFRAHLSLATHLMRKGLRQFSAEAPEATLQSLEIAAQQMEQSVREMHWVMPYMKAPRLAIHESLGAAREANGDYQGALAAYDFTAALEDGWTAHYRAGLLNGKLAAKAWNTRRAGEALGYFIEAKRRLSEARQFLPADVTPAQRLEYVAYLDRSIAYLQGAKITPIPPK